MGRWGDRLEDLKFYPEKEAEAEAEAARTQRIDAVFELLQKERES